MTNLATALDGHGGISSIHKSGSQALVDTYTITYADTTTSTFNVTNGNGITSIEYVSTSGATDTYRITLTNGDYTTFTVTNGNSITGISKVSSSGLTDTYRVSMTDGSHSDFEVTNGRGISGISWTSSGTAGDGQIHTGTISYNDGTNSQIVFEDGVKGDTGETWYVSIRWSAVAPTSDVDMTTTPSDYIGVYYGLDDPDDLHYDDYQWFKVKGDKGDTGDDADISSQVVEYQLSNSGNNIPQGSWSPTVPTLTNGYFLWTRTTVTFNTGNSMVSYSVGYIGIDGTGSGDMTKIIYDNTSAVMNAGGIAEYVALQLQSYLNSLEPSTADIGPNDMIQVFTANEGNVKMVLEDLVRPLEINFGTVTSLPVTYPVQPEPEEGEPTPELVTDTRIKASMRPLSTTYGTPSAFPTSPTLTVDDGIVTLSGTIASGASSTVKVLLSEVRT